MDRARDLNKKNEERIPKKGEWEAGSFIIVYAYSSFSGIIRFVKRTFLAYSFSEIGGFGGFVFAGIAKLSAIYLTARRDG